MSAPLHLVVGKAALEGGARAHQQQQLPRARHGGVQQLPGVEQRA